MWYFPTVGLGAVATTVSYLSVDRKGRATLPEEVRVSLGLRSGDFVLLEKTDRGTYELVPAALVPRDQLWFYHPEMQGRVRKAEADVAEGRTSVTRSLEGAKALLASNKGKRPRGRR